MLVFSGIYLSTDPIIHVDRYDIIIKNRKEKGCILIEYTKWQNPVCEVFGNK